MPPVFKLKPADELPTSFSAGQDTNMTHAITPSDVACCATVPVMIILDLLSTAPPSGHCRSPVTYPPPSPLPPFRSNKTQTPGARFCAVHDRTRWSTLQLNTIAVQMNRAFLGLAMIAPSNQVFHIICPNHTAAWICHVRSMLSTVSSPDLIAYSSIFVEAEILKGQYL